MSSDPITSISELVREVFGFAVGSKNYDEMSREAKLTRWEQGYNEALTKTPPDMAVCDAILNVMRDLRRHTGP